MPTQLFAIENPLAKVIRIGGLGTLMRNTPGRGKTYFPSVVAAAPGPRITSVIEPLVGGRIVCTAVMLLNGKKSIGSGDGST